jgi:serine/threonine protein kinase
VGILQEVIELICATCGKVGAPGTTRCPACSGLMIVNSNPEPPPPPKPEPSLVGTSFGKYALTAEIGRGSMGVVYDAQDTLLHRRVALKLMHASKDEARETVNNWQRFMQEARLTANVAKHPNIVTVYEAAVVDSRRYIAMEYVSGEPMQRWRKGRSPREQVRLLRDVALAVHHAHEHGIIHRDLKPANVLVAKGGIPVITDFGLARSEQRHAGPSLTPSGFVVGSPAYMSPEQARGQRDVDRTTDVYAIGIMLYEAIAGHPPFDGRNPVETLSKVVEGTRVPPSQVAPLPQGDPVLDQICLKAMARDAQERYPTCADLAQALTRWLDEPRERGAARPRIGVFAAAAAGALAIAGALFWLQHRSLRQREDEMHAHLRATMKKLEELKTAPAPPPRGYPPFALRLEEFQWYGEGGSNPSSPTVLNYYQNGRFETRVDVPETGEYEVTVKASCDQAKGEFAIFRLSIDGNPEPDTALTSEKARPYTRTLRLTAGWRRLGIAFTNDWWDPQTKEDRNLRVHEVVLRRTR